ncbi:hypothetical protein ASG93_16870 [Paenibacillus sp. Soil787]|nr:hypothetical protein ASG93_16870 [Paenibacillus sp. Soil787]
MRRLKRTSQLLRVIELVGYALRKQKRPSRRPVWSESGVRRLKRTSQLLNEGKLVGLRSDKAEAFPSIRKILVFWFYRRSSFHRVK